jgi:hypothetical protein
MSVLILELLIAAVRRGLPFIEKMSHIANKAKAEGRTELTDEEIDLLRDGAVDAIDDYLAGVPADDQGDQGDEGENS